MDLVALDANIDSNGFVDSYDSLIWTERFATYGEFSVTGHDIAYLRNKMPLDTHVTLSDTPQVMLVEHHEIGVDDNGEKQITVSGRSLECLWEQRVYPPIEGLAFQTWNSYTNKAAVYQLLKQFNGGTTVGYAGTFGFYDPTPEGGTQYKAAFENGSFADNIQKFRSAGNFGISPNQAPQSMYAGNPAIRVYFDIYSGKDRTDSQPLYPIVTFSVPKGEYDADSYLWDRTDVFNIARVFASDGRNAITGPKTSSNINRAGRARREMYVDATDIDVSNISDSDLYDILCTRGRNELALHMNQVLISGKVTAQTSNVYRTDYFLGDIVTVAADYGVKQDMQVAEYIRSQDSSGEIAYPSLVVNAQGALTS